MPGGPARIHAQGSVRDALREHYATHARNAEKIQKYNLGLAEDDELPPYTPQEYPKAMFTLELESIVVADAREERAKLGEGYYATYAEAKAAQEELEAADSEPEEAYLRPGDETLAAAVDQQVRPKPKPKRSHKKKPAAA